MSPDEFCHWAKTYHEQFGFKCVPVTGKTELWLTDAPIWDDSHKLLTISEGTPKLDGSILEADDWLEQVCHIAQRYPKALTGIGCHAHASKVVGLDFDDRDFFQSWKKIYRIKCPIVKTAKGFHGYVRCDEEINKTLITDHYDVQGWRTMDLPPSFYYIRTDLTKQAVEVREWLRRPGDMDRYTWHEMWDIPHVKIKEIGLVPEWFLREEDHKIHSARKAQRIKFL